MHEAGVRNVSWRKLRKRLQILSFAQCRQDSDLHAQKREVRFVQVKKLGRASDVCTNRQLLLLLMQGATGSQPNAPELLWK